MNSSGVRPGRRTISIFMPGSAFASHHACISSAARSMWPCCSHCGSKSADLFGMRMYSHSVGTIDSSQARVDVALQAFDVHAAEFIDHNRPRPVAVPAEERERVARRDAPRVPRGDSPRAARSLAARAADTSARCVGSAASAAGRAAADRARRSRSAGGRRECRARPRAGAGRVARRRSSP